MTPRRSIVRRIFRPDKVMIEVDRVVTDSTGTGKMISIDDVGNS